MRGAVFAWTFAKICTIFVVYEGDCMKKRRFSVAVAIFAVALAFSGCDLIAPVPEEIPPEIYEPILVKGTDRDNKIVVITFSTTRGPPANKAVMPSLKDHDSYEIKFDNTAVSKGEIIMDDTGFVVTFIPNEEGQSFRAAWDPTPTKRALRFYNNPIPIAGKPIYGYQSDLDDGVVSPDAKVIAKRLDRDEINAQAIGENVVINGPIKVEENINIPDGIKLIFNSRDDDAITIGENPKTDIVTITAKGGIDVSLGRGVTLTGKVSLVIDKKSEFEGRLIVGDGATLDIAENLTIKKGGVLALAGNDTVRWMAFIKKYPTTLPPSAPPPQYPTGNDAILKLRGDLTVKDGGRFQMPDPLWYFTKNNITGAIIVESGGELILVTADPNGLYDLHPWIGTVSTATQGAPVGADYVMYPDTNAEGKIVVRNSSGSPALELSGTATALGRLILDEKYNPNKNFQYAYSSESGYWDEDTASGPIAVPGSDKGFYQKPPYYRLEVWLTYPFTVTYGSSLYVGNSTEYFLRSSLFVTGMSYLNLDKTTGIYYKGVLTNNGKVYVYDKNGILEWFGGYFDHKVNVKNKDGGDLIPMLGRIDKQYEDDTPEDIDVDVKAWTPIFVDDFVAIPNPDKWWPPWFKTTKLIPPQY
jgi:hypothetical protein